MVEEKLENKIKSWISEIAGIVNFKPLTIQNGVDVENDGVFVEKNKNKNSINLTIGLVILINLNAKIVVEEIYQIVNYKLKEEKIKIGKLSIYIKGIK
ncbi:hypothetical protein [Metamycoplasma gateae]|uniref:Asp23/Gls24 family envelope stress response protein n=1 Tax=Metamycoplasma gateae TaxID=35769 RepID=A0ABZ2AGN3_9BACT|nr:hypothetical protein V2E26_02525 [Metamycoplasma gateae]